MAKQKKNQKEVKQQTPISDAPEAQLHISDNLFMAVGNVDTDRGVIEDVAIVMEGQAKGHGVSLDKEFIRETVKQGQESGTSGIKARFGHPSMSATSLGTFLGRFKNFREDTSNGKSLARADLFLSNSAKDTPNGDLHNYVLSLAADDAKAFGNSIVFQKGREYVRNEKGQKDFIRYQEGPAGISIKTRSDGTELKRGEETFIEMKKLRASDLVDDPAATNGLFSTFNQATWAGQMSEFLDTHPEIFELVRNNPDVIDGFFDRYERYKERKELDMAKDEKQEVEEELADANEVEVNADTPDGEEAGEPEAAPEEEVQQEEKPEEALEETPVSEGERFLAAFGDIGGVWFAKGLTFEQAQEKYLETIKAENESLKAKLAAVSEDGEEPVPFEEAPAVEAEGDFMEQATEMARAEGITMQLALSKLAKEKPELFKAYKEGNRKK